MNQSQTNRAAFSKKSSRNHHDGGETGEHLKVQQKLKDQMQTLNMLSSLETLMTNDN